MRVIDEASEQSTSNEIPHREIVAGGLRVSTRLSYKNCSSAISGDSSTEKQHFLGRHLSGRAGHRVFS
jgi:hypothetical protein